MQILDVQDLGEALDVGEGYRRVRVTYQYGDGITTIETVVRATFPDDSHL